VLGRLQELAGDDTECPQAVNWAGPTATHAQQHGPDLPDCERPGTLRVCAGFKQADVQDSAYKYTLKATLSTS